MADRNFYLKHKAASADIVIYDKGTVKMVESGKVYRVIIRGVQKPALVTRSLGEALAKYTKLCYLYGV